MLECDFKTWLGDFSLQLKFSFPSDGITVIFGQSGSGKSSLLNMIAGFDQPTEYGSIHFNDQNWLALSPSGQIEKTPIQQRNLEVAWGCKVIDRTGIILEIFGARAKTHEGRLQVELASLSFQRSRLVRSWTHLERQRGGAGFLGGPGERQIELDRRQIDSKIKYIKLELERVTKTRFLHRSSRSKKPVPVVAFVGYTNAGKSTLFNRLTGANVLADDMLFATLDPTMRRIELPSGRQIVLSDTVGFVSNLPTHLVAAFRATLEEVLEADIIVHVRDVSHSETELQKYDVEQVLNYLGVHNTIENSNTIEVLNKADKLESDEYQRYKNNISENEVLLSAINGKGCTVFYDKIDQLLGNTETLYNFQIQLNNGCLLYTSDAADE